MDGIVNRLMELHGGQLLVPAAICAVLFLIFKAITGIHQTRGSARREFLELFQEVDKKDDLWLSACIRHQFGAHLPVSIIRRLSKLDQPSRAIQEVADAWPLIDLDDASGELRWERWWYGVPAVRRRIAIALFVGYFVFGMVSALMALALVSSDMGNRESFAYWLWVIICAAAAVFCLNWSVVLKHGAPSLERWLGMK